MRKNETASARIAIVGHRLAALGVTVCVGSCLVGCTTLGVQSESGGSDSAQIAEGQEDASPLSESDEAGAASDEMGMDEAGTQPLEPGASAIQPSDYLAALPYGVISGYRTQNDDPSDDVIAADRRYADALNGDGVFGSDDISGDFEADGQALEERLLSVGYAGDFTTRDDLFGDEKGFSFSVGYPGGMLQGTVYTYSDVFDKSFKLEIKPDGCRGMFEYTTDMIPSAAAVEEISGEIVEEYQLESSKL